MSKRTTRDNKHENVTQQAVIVQNSERGAKAFDTGTGASQAKTKLSGPLVGRTQLARILGVSPSTVIRHIEGRLIQPVVDDRGYHRFALDDIETVRQSFEVTRFRRPAVSGPSELQPARESDRDTHVAILELLDAGAGPVDIAKKLRLLPHELDPVVKWWTQSKGCYFLSEEQAEQVWAELREHSCRPHGNHKPKDGAGLAQLAAEVGARCSDLKDELSAKRTCKPCAADQAVYCPSCAKKKFSRHNA